MRLPERNRDLTRYINRRRTVRILLFAGWVALLTLSAWMYNRSHSVSVLPPITGWRMAVWILASAVSGALVFRIPQMLTDRTCEGTIVSSGHAHSYSGSSDPGAGRDSSYQFRLNTVLRIRTADGDLRRLRFEEKPGFFLYYHEGNYVRHIAGLPYPVADPNRSLRREKRKMSPYEDRTGSTGEESGEFLCAACGHFCPAPTVCESCGLTVIDPNEFFES